MNEDLIVKLKELGRITALLDERYRSEAYYKAANSIGKLTFKIDKNFSPFDTKISGVGKGIAAKIVEYTETGDIAELRQLLNDKKIKAYDELSKIIGVGPVTVKRWITNGIYSIGDLVAAIKKGTIKLTEAQTIGLHYYNDLNTRIPRAYVEEVFYSLRQWLPAKCMVVGSYRRGAATSGDIDIICQGSISNDILKHAAAIISKGPERISFIWCLKRCVQVDILITTSGSQFWAALNYFTGSAEHNEYLRGVAKKKGFRLNQNGLFKLPNMTRVMLNSEEDIYKTLGVDYLPPTAR